VNIVRFPYWLDDFSCRYLRSMSSSSRFIMGGIFINVIIGTGIFEETQ
jgi:hypothetical protein